MPKDEVKSEKVSKKEAVKLSDKKSDNTPAKKSGKSKDQKKQPNAVAKYFKDLKSEFKKVVWPTKKQVTNNTAVVIVTILLIGVFVASFDLLAGFLLKFILNR